jgi:ligand-binding SRPBCC domain-containing protein
VELTPPAAELQIVRIAEPYGLGSEIEMSMRIGLQRVNWRARIVEFEPPRLFVDEMLEGPFKSWRHRHEFHADGPDQTRVVDTIDYELPLGLLGAWADAWFVSGRIDRMFEYRSARLHEWARSKR